MANKKAEPGMKKILMPFTLRENLKIEIIEMSELLDISMSAFVEICIREKIHRMRQK